MIGQRLFQIQNAKRNPWSRWSLVISGIGKTNASLSKGWINKPYVHKHHYVSVYSLKVWTYVSSLINARCKIPGYDNDTYAIQSPYHEALVNQTIPLNPKDKRQPYEKCHYYRASNQTGTMERIQCSQWVYDRSIVRETFTTKVIHLTVQTFANHY